MKDSNKPLVSIVILNWNGLEDTKKCLESVEKIRYKNTEVIVVDNGSTDGSKKYLQKQTGIKLIDLPHNTGFTGGHIQGHEASSGKYIMLLNNDAVVDKNYIDTALEHFSNDMNIAAVGGRAYFWSDEHKPYDTNNPFYSFQTINPTTAEAISNQADSGRAQEVNNVSGSCVMVRRSALKEIGYLYEPFFAYYEETDLFARMKRAGYKIIYDPRLAIWHKIGASSNPLFMYRQLYKNRFLFAVRNFESKYLRQFIRTYTKTGIIATIYRLKRGPNQELYTGFSQGFFAAIKKLPATLKSRNKLAQTLPKNRNYNHIIIKEQNPISFVISYDGLTKEAVKDWKDFASMNPLHEFVIVSHKNLQKTGWSANVRFMVDKGYFKTHQENIGWLCAKNDFIYVHLKKHGLPNISELESKAIQLIENQAWVRYIRNAGGSITGTLYARELLIKYGGFTADQKLKNASYYLGLYAGLWQPKKLLDTTTDQILQRLSTSSVKQSEIEKQIALKVEQDKRTSRKPNLWTKILEKNYRIYQLRNYLRWFFSPRISLRLKAARNKNLLLSAVFLQRKRFATELKHISNEALRIVIGHIDIEKQNLLVENIGQELQTNWQNTPVFIICRDRVEPLKILVEWLEKAGMKKVVFIDNDSIYQPLVDYLHKTTYQTLPTGRNIGHTSPWSSGIIKTLLPKEYYIVTDPDVIPTEEAPNDSVLHFLKLHIKYPTYQKVGFGLKIDDLPDNYPLKESVIEWEKQFWTNELEQDVYEAPLDTTFALYKPFTYKYSLTPSIRTGGHYTARHLPWYSNPSNMSEEEFFYRARANGDISSWNADKLKDRYKVEMKKKRNK